jgi:hypothetical protein
MTESTLHPHGAHRDTLIRIACQIAMWAIVGLKVIWLAMALVFVGPRWQVLVFWCALLVLAGATLSFGNEHRTQGIGLAWLGVLIAIAVGYFGGATPSPLTDAIHDQFRTHIADFVFLAVAHLQFWILGNGNLAPKTAVPTNVS